MWDLYFYIQKTISRPIRKTRNQALKLKSKTEHLK